jgi:uncharacterized protein YdhG (YjbR/CyaY superfamily)
MKNARGLTRISKKNKEVKNGHSTPRARNAEVSAFIGKYPPDVRKILVKIRETIRKAAPQAQETISYMMPAYRLGGNLVYFSGFKDHISFFPTSSGISAFKKELSCYKTSKGTVRFELNKSVPYGLISRIVKYRVKEMMRRKNGK